MQVGFGRPHLVFFPEEKGRAEVSVPALMSYLDDGAADVAGAAGDLM